MVICSPPIPRVKGVGSSIRVLVFMALLLYGDLVFPVHGMEVWDSMLVVEHPDDDAEESRYFGQLMRSPARVIVSLRQHCGHDRGARMARWDEVLQGSAAGRWIIKG